MLKRDGFDYYVGCNYCNRAVHSTEGLQLQCMNCGHTDSITVRRRKKNSKLIHKAIVDKIYLNSLLTLANPIGQRKTCILALEIEFEQKPIAWVRGKIILLKTILTYFCDGFDYYVGCNYCNKGIHSMEGLQLHCLFCGQIDGITLRRYKVEIEIFDNVGTVHVTMFNHEVHRLMLMASSNIPTCEKDVMLQQKLDNLVFGLKKNTIVSEQRTMTYYAVACVCKQLDSGESNDGLLMLGNPTKRRLDFGQLSGDVDNAQASSSFNDKREKTKNWLSQRILCILCT
nr:replication protein A 70 kDa DNA-binding subunit B-like [Ipomoea batatas]